ncbi:MAG: Spy/CpxP family protein refolding chaperone [Geminicoccaceae bacterium]|nr:Spy/CpxP family protein refolding chaperone [Geminicoccaceae bacterium]
MSEEQTTDSQTDPKHRAGRRFKTSHLALVVVGGLALLGVAGAALHAGERHGGGFHAAHFAGGHHGRGHGMMMGRMCSDQRAEWLDERIAVVESFVDFTPEQEPAWSALKESVRDGSERVGEACASLEGAEDGPVGRLARMETMLAAGLDVVQGVRPAFEDFYAVLDEDQQAALDRLIERRGRRE